MGTYIIINNPDELYHHGVLGMKWGVRRYQSYAENPKLSGWKERRAARKAAKEQKLHDKALNSTSAEQLLKRKKYLTEEEFEKKANSMVLEAKLKDIANAKSNSIGRQAMNRVLTDAAVSAIKIGALVGAGYLVSKTPMGKELIKNAKGAYNTMKKLANVGDAAKDVRKAAADSNLGKKYVETVQNVAKAAKDTRTAAAKSDLGQVYVKAVRKVANTGPVKGVLKDTGDIRRRAARSEAGQKYVKAVNKLIRKVK